MPEREHLPLTLSFKQLEDSGWFEVRIEEFPEVFTAPRRATKLAWRSSMPSSGTWRRSKRTSRCRQPRLPDTPSRRGLHEALGALQVELSADELGAIDRAVPLGAAAGTRYAEPLMAGLDSER